MKSLNQKIIEVNTIFKTIMMAIFMASAVASFGSKDHKKTISESYDISNGATVELINKYGNVDVRTIAEDRVSIRVEILVDAPNESKAEEVFKRLNVSTYGTSNSVKVETKIDSQNKGFWKSITSWNKGGNYQIHYYIEVPEHVHLMITNKYGNIYAEDMDNELDIVLKYGNFEIGSAHDVDIDLGYGKGKMDDVHNLDLDLKYSQIEAESAYDVDITSKYSQFSVDEAREIDAESKYDKFRIRKADRFENEGKYDNLRLGEIGEVEIDSKHTDIDIDKLEKSAYIRTGYGGIRINEITSEMEEIDIVSSYADIKIENPSEVGFRFDIETNHASIRIDNGDGDFGDDDDDEWAKGKRPGKGNGLVKIESKYGNVRIR